MSDPVLVGVDGSEASLAAVDVAVREARLRGCGLRIVHAFIWPLMHVSLGPAQGGPAGAGCGTRRRTCWRTRAPGPGRWIPGWRSAPNWSPASR